jgi:hypothetical protein
MSFSLLPGASVSRNNMLFVGLLTPVFALFLELKLIPLTIGDFDLSKFADDRRWALLIGTIAGIGEKGLCPSGRTRAKSAGAGLALAGVQR